MLTPVGCGLLTNGLGCIEKGCVTRESQVEELIFDNTALNITEY